MLIRLEGKNFANFNEPSPIIVFVSYPFIVTICFRYFQLLLFCFYLFRNGPVILSILRSFSGLLSFKSAPSILNEKCFKRTSSYELNYLETLLAVAIKDILC